MNEYIYMIITEILTQGLLNDLDRDIAAILSLFTDTKLEGEQDVSTPLVLSISKNENS